MVLFILLLHSCNAVVAQQLPLSYMQDRGYPLEMVIEFPADSFSVTDGSVLNLGLDDKPYWLKLTEQSLDDILLLDYPLLDSIKMFFVHANCDVLNHVSGGDMAPFSQRLYPSQLFVFEVPKGTTSVYIRARSTNHLLFPFSSVSESELRKQLSRIDIFFGMFFGIIIALFLYNTFIYLTVKDKAYSFYILYLVFILFSHASLNGFHSRIIFPDSPLAANQFLLISTALSGVFAISFAIRFLRVRFFAPVFYWPLRLFQVMYLVLCVVTLFHISSTLTSVFDVFALFLALYGLLFSVVIARKGYRPAYFFLAAWTVFLLGLTIFVLRNFGVLPYTFVTNHMVQIGVASEVLLLSFALADRIKILQREKDKNQLTALEVSKENERIIREQNVFLEKRVAERTGELVTINQKLETTVAVLKDTQTQLVEQEKMASLGQLTAGIAHEINNPINFVINNLKPLRLDIDDVFALQTRAEELLANAPELLRDFENEKQALDYVFVTEEINQLIAGIEEGARRTSEIVLGLRSFSRLDEEDAKRADIAEGLRSTLVLLNNKTKGIIDVHEDYADQNTIECYPGKLNQVFMNLLSNAIDAVTSKNEDQEKDDQESFTPALWISTRRENQRLLVTIKDNGIGMSEDIKHRIFEPFFTTKDVGKGTGLGMSIVFKIIQAHKGELIINSKEGEGTTITLSLLEEMEDIFVNG